MDMVVRLGQLILKELTGINCKLYFSTNYLAAQVMVVLVDKEEDINNNLIKINRNMDRLSNIAKEEVVEEVVVVVEVDIQDMVSMILGIHNHSTKEVEHQIMEELEMLTAAVALPIMVVVYPVILMVVVIAVEVIIASKGMTTEEDTLLLEVMVSTLVLV